MKKIMMLLVIVLSSWLMGCNIEDGDMKERLNSPENKMIPIQGKWIIEKQLGAEVIEDSNIGLEMLFHSNGVVIGSESTVEPNFKYKKVNSYDYLIYKYKISPRSIGFDNNTIDVITLYGGNQYLYEFIKHDDENLFVYMDNKFYKLKNILRTVSIDEVNRYIDIQKNARRSLSFVEENKKTGLLLGVKTPVYDDLNNLSQWKYDTIYINWELGMLKAIYRMEDILFPRMNGFYKVKVERDTSINYIEDNISINPIQNIIEEKIIEDENDYMPFSTAALKEEKDRDSIIKNIQYLGNDYISIETINLDSGSKRILEIHLVDNFTKNKPMRLMDIIGEEGKKIFIEGAQGEIALEEAEKIRDTNISLNRKNGYWMFKGRVNYRSNEEELYKDFDIKAIPPGNMVSYDQLLVPWTEVKRNIPDADDIYFSPNEEVLIAIKKNKIYAYPLDNGDISLNNGVEILQIGESSSIIMAEWARGEYVGYWENEILKNGGQLVE